MNLAIASFAIAAVGIILQFVDAFPEHREVRRTIVIMSIGFFVGVGASTLMQTNYQITGNVDGRYLLLFSLLAVSFFFAALATLLGDPGKRANAGVAAAVAAIALGLAGFGIGLGSIDRHGDISSDELIVLANAAEQRRAY